MSTTAASPSASISSDASVTSTLSASSSISSLISTAIGGSITSAINGTIASSTSSASSSTKSSTPNYGAGTAQTDTGISLVAFLTALTSAIVIFAVQIAVFLLLRNNLARIFKPKTYLVPERERTDAPPVSPWGMLARLLQFKDREIIKKCGLDAYFFLRYLQTLLVIFIPIAVFVIPIIVPLNFYGGKGQSILNSTSAQSGDNSNVSGLDTLAWGNVRRENSGRYTGHLVMAILVIIWVCAVFFVELKVYIKVRQDYLTTAEHRLRASATTVLVNSIPKKWLSERALAGLFDVFPGGIRNIWLTRDLTSLLEKIQKRDKIQLQLEAAETELIRMAKKKQLKERNKEYKKARQNARAGAESKEEREHRQKEEDEKARRLAESGGGMSSGAHHGVPQNVDEACEESREEEEETDKRMHKPSAFAKVTQGIKGGVSKANKDLLGGHQFELTTGFMKLGGSSEPGSAPPTRGSDRRRVHIAEAPEREGKSIDGPSKSYHSRTASGASQSSTDQKPSFDVRGFGNTVRTATNLEEMYVTEKTKWYEFWKPPSGGYASPIPQGADSDEFPLTGKASKPQNRSFWQKMKPFSEEELEPVDYPEYKNFDDPKDREAGAEWEKWLRQKDRPTHRVPFFEWTPGWLPGLPLIHKKVDTIYWCRKELARLNMEIEYDQKHPERYPLMNSAFIQFNHQVAAHMACQSVIHHVPKQMSPRDVEISPNDIIWDNMAITWWQEWVRTVIVYALVTGMIVLWAIPVAWSASLSNIDSLITALPWLGFLDKNETVRSVVNAAAGVLPATFLAILLIIVPLVFDFLAGFKGAKTGAQKAETVQIFYFAFLFVQVFLIVSVASGAIQAFSDLKNISNTVQDIPNILAENLPKAANYFFSYMILQALSTSSGTLLQIGTLIVWYVVARMLDSTARAKWNRNTTLPRVTWGSFFPVYTNFACIALVYCIVAPIISIFAIITFSLLWVAHRYNMLYVTRFANDTGGVLYPRAINQTFTGLYVMELCLVGLFFLVRDENNNAACFPHAITMIVMIILTIIYQYLLNRSFAPLFRYLPVTFEDEAVLRDEAFQRAQDCRLGLINDDDEAEGQSISNGISRQPSNDIELSKLDGQGASAHGLHKLTQGKLNPVRGIVHAGTWAARGAARGAGNLHKMTLGRAESDYKNASEYRRLRRQKDLEAQRAIGEALYGGYHDEIEDLTPDERDMLVRHAFQHYALRARQPTVWLPRDDIGVSDDEIKRTKEFSEFVWISNEGTALDSKVRVVYGRNPPDFSDVDLINL